MKEEFFIKQLRRGNEQALGELNVLLLQLSSRGYQMDIGQLQSVLEDSHNTVLVLYCQDTAIGMITLVSLHQATGNKGYIEDLVVDEQYRGRKLGEKLVLEAMAVAKRKQVDSIELKSETHRIAANRLYQKVGFALQKANVYKMKLL